MMSFYGFRPVDAGNFWRGRPAQVRNELAALPGPNTGGRIGPHNYLAALPGPDTGGRIGPRNYLAGLPGPHTGSEIGPRNYLAELPGPNTGGRIGPRNYLAKLPGPNAGGRIGPRNYLAALPGPNTGGRIGPRNYLAGLMSGPGGGVEGAGRGSLAGERDTAKRIAAQLAQMDEAGRTKAIHDGKHWQAGMGMVLSRPESQRPALWGRMLRELERRRVDISGADLHYNPNQAAMLAAIGAETARQGSQVAARQVERGEAAFDRAAPSGAEHGKRADALPAPLVKRLRAGILSGAPHSEVAAAMRIARLAQRDPATVAGIPADERARAAAIAEFAELGLNPARAVALAEKRLAARRVEDPDVHAGDGVLAGGAGGDVLENSGAGAEKETSRQQGASADQRSGSGDWGMPGNSPGATPPELKRLEKGLRDRAYLARKMGLETAAGFLERFLDGWGGTVTLKRDRMRGFRAIRDAEKTNRNRVITRGFLGQQPGGHPHNDALGNIQDGQTIELESDHWDREFTTWGLAMGGEWDLALATGSSKLRTEGAYRATRKGDVIHIEGTVSHTWMDRYDFHGKDDLAHDAKRLQDAGRGVPFDVEAKWKQVVKGTIRIEDGKLADPRFQWTDAR